MVVKPRDGNQGKGVTVNIVDREHFDAAYRAADEIGEVMVEQFLPGHDFRLLVVGDKLVAARARSALGGRRRRAHGARAGGQGQCRPAPRRRACHLADAHPPRRHRDRAWLQGLTADSVPPTGQRVVLRNNANLSPPAAPPPT